MILNLNNVNAYADGFGNWHAEVPVDNTVNTSHAYLTAREAIHRELAAREQTTRETFEEALKRMRSVVRVGVKPTRTTETYLTFSEITG